MYKFTRINVCVEIINRIDKLQVYKHVLFCVFILYSVLSLNLKKNESYQND